MPKACGVQCVDGNDGAVLVSEPAVEAGAPCWSVLDPVLMSPSSEMLLSGF